ncbi:unnamed protein product, partial [Brenthis ino]
MSFWPISATAANLIETSQLRRRYYSAQVNAQTQRALSIPVTLILRLDDYSTRPVGVEAQDNGFTCSSKHGGETRTQTGTQDSGCAAVHASHCTTEAVNNNNSVRNSYTDSKSK